MHYTRADVWYDLVNENPVPYVTLERDDATTYDGVPSLHVGLDGYAVLGDSRSCGGRARPRAASGSRFPCAAISTAVGLIDTACDEFEPEG